MSEKQIEKEIQEKGLNAPRLTPDHIDSVIVDEAYHVFPNTTLTVCCLKLDNGYTVTGESAAASHENFDEEIGRKIARENARNKIWMLEGYLLKERLSNPMSNVDLTAINYSQVQHVTAAVEGGEPLITFGKEGGEYVAGAVEIDADNTAVVVMFNSAFLAIKGE